MIRFGIVGTGRICHEFAEGLRVAKYAQLSAVASRSQDKADAFAQRYNAPHSYGSYEAMTACSDIDVVYIGTPNHCHIDNVKMFLENGNNVLCEKPIGVNARQTREMIVLAKSKNLFLMEGMWTRFYPAVQKAVEWVRAGAIGDVNMININMGINIPLHDWRFRLDMAGGAVLDLGVYTVAITFSMLGSKYSQLLGTSKLIGGVDAINTATLVYPSGALAVMNFGLRQVLDNGVYIQGSKGQIRLGNEMWWTGRYSELTMTDGAIVRHEGKVTRFEEPYTSTGFQFEADHVAQCIADGLTESPVMTHKDSLDIADTLDAMRRLYGIKYEQDA